MKDFKKLQESILANIDNTIDGGDAAVQKVLNDEILSMFNRDKKAKYNDIITFVGDDNLILSTQLRKEVISKCCSYDGKILTINFDKIRDGWKYSVAMVVSGKSKRLPPVKIISSSDRIKGNLNPGTSNASVLRLKISAGKSIDINDYIHKDTNIE